MALIASKSNVFTDRHSRLELKTCVIYLWIPTFVVWLLNICFLLIYYYICRRISADKVTQEVSIDHSSMIMTPLSIRSCSSPVMINRSVSVASLSDTTFQSSSSRLFKVLLCLLLILVIALMFASNEKTTFNIGMLSLKNTRT